MPVDPRSVTTPTGPPGSVLATTNSTASPTGVSLFIEVDMRLAAMDTAGIGVQALSPNPLTYLHYIDPPEAVDFCRAHNDSLAEVVADHPDRFVGLGALPMQDIDAACEELRRMVAELGLLGGYIGTDFPTALGRSGHGRALCHLRGVGRAAVSCTPASRVSTVRCATPGCGAGDLDLVLEYSLEEALAAATLVFGGVLVRHPALDVCVSHGGGSLAMALSKLRKLAERRPASPEWLKAPGVFDEQIERLWFDLPRHRRAGVRLRSGLARYRPAGVRHQLRRMGQGHRAGHLGAGGPPSTPTAPGCCASNGGRRIC